MRADQHGDAGRRQLLDQLPEFAPCIGVDTRGGLIKEQQLRLVQHAGGQRQALLPAARQRPGQLIAALRQPEFLRDIPRRLFQRVDLIHAADEFEILAHRQVFVEAEALRHVAHAPLDLARLAADIEAQARSLAGVRRQQPAQHADGRGLAAAIGPEKAEDRAARHVQREIIHHLLAVEALGQAAHADRLRRVTHGATTVTSTGWPTRRLVARSSGRASTMNTRRERCSRL